MDVIYNYMTLRYCPNCKRNINTERGYNAVVLVILLIFFFIPGIIYWAIKREQRCPICHTPDTMLTAPVFNDVTQSENKSAGNP
jgi:RNA polymerase subunit RPABC4/transcription elongation factor Spt4